MHKFPSSMIDIHSHDDLSQNNVSWPMISIVTPSFNQGHFIESTIKSVITQGYPNLQYIIIDGGSSDSTLGIIQKYEKFISFWSSEPDDGQSSAINKGLRLATGPIVAWINSDDVYLPGTFFKIASFFLRYPDTVFVYGRCQSIDEAGNLISEMKTQSFNFEDFINGDYIAQPSVFFKKCVLDEVGFIDESLHYAMDYELWFRIALKNPIEYIDEPLSQFRLQPESKTVSNSKKFHYDIINFFIKKLYEENIDPAFIPTIIQKICYEIFLALFSVPYQQKNNKTELSREFENILLPDQDKALYIDLFIDLIQFDMLNLIRMSLKERLKQIYFSLMHLSNHESSEFQNRQFFERWIRSFQPNSIYGTNSLYSTLQNLSQQMLYDNNIILSLKFFTLSIKLNNKSIFDITMYEYLVRLFFRLALFWPRQFKGVIYGKDPSLHK